MTNNPLAKQFTAASLLRFAFPNIIMMVFMSLYTIVDGMFISRYAGELALSALNMFYPVTSIQLGLGIMLGTGGSAVIGRKLGAGQNREAKEDFTLITAAAFVTGLLTAIPSLFFLEPILRLLGTSGLQMPFCIPYAVILLLFSPMMFLQMVFQVFFVTAGKPRLGLWLTVAGGAANMLLDYLFMGPMQMGVAGAAIATGIGYSIPAAAGLVYFSVMRHGSLCFVKFPFRGETMLRACTNGSSEMVSNAAIAVTTFLFNLIFMHFWAEEGIAAIAILSYYQFVFSAVFMGFSLGVSPVISFKYGAQDQKQLRHIFRISFGFVSAVSVLVYLLSLFTVRYTLLIFTDVGSPVYNLSMEGFPLYALQFLFLGISILSSGLFTALGDGLVSGMISLSRTFVFLTASLLLLPALFGETGVWIAVPAAELLGLLVSVVFLLTKKKKYRY